MTVTVDPKLGKLTLNARKAGAVYVAQVVSGQQIRQLIDANAMNPTRTLFP